MFELIWGGLVPYFIVKHRILLLDNQGHYPFLWLLIKKMIFFVIRGMFDKDRIAKLKKGVLIVNNARAAIMDTQAVVDGCSSGQIGGDIIIQFFSSLQMIQRCDFPCNFYFLIAYV